MVYINVHHIQKRRVKKVEEPYVHKIFIGKRKKIGHQHASNRFDQPWETSMFKTATDDQTWLGKTGLTGDEGNSRTIDKAVFAYAIKHYAYWENELSIEKIAMGSMGENLSVLEMDEYTVCIGDIYKFGDALIQVSQPHQPSWEAGRRFKVLDLPLYMQNSGRTGWYFRVLEEGDVLSRIDMELIKRPHPQWSIAACNEVMHTHKNDLRLTNELAACESLSANWRQLLSWRLRGQERSAKKRLYGPNISSIPDE